MERKEGLSGDLEGGRAGNVQEEGALLPGPVGGGHEVVGPRYYLKLHILQIINSIFRCTYLLFMFTQLEELSVLINMLIPV